MDCEKYKNTDPYPDRPSKPMRPKAYEENSVSLKKYADEMGKWEVEMVAYRREQSVWREKEMKLEAQFKADLLEDLGITGHPKADLLYAKAWEHGHSSGLHEVYQYACDLVELIQ